MEDNGGETVLNQEETRTKVSVRRQATRFVFHLASVYLVVLFCSSAFAGWTYRSLFSALQIHTQRSSFEFLFTHLLFFSFVPSFVTGLLNARFNHRVAEFVWTVPTVVLLYKLITFPHTPSVLAQTSSWPALHEYFGGGFLISEFHNWSQFAQLFSNPDMVRGMTQRTFTAPFYGGIAYSLAALIGGRNPSLQIALGRLRHSERWQPDEDSPALQQEAAHKTPELRALLQGFDNQENTAAPLQVHDMSEHGCDPASRQ